MPRTRTHEISLSLALLAGLALGAGGCGQLLGMDDEEAGPPGVLYYTTDADGTVEVWAFDLAAAAPVRITDGMSQPDVPSPWAPTPSWDGTQVAVSSLRAEDGSFDGDRHLWQMAPDGGDLTYLARSNPGTASYGLSWEGDGAGLLYADDEPCSNNLWRIDARAPGSEVALYDVDVVEPAIAAEPRVNPVDANQVLFVEQECGTVGARRLLTLDDLQVHAIPGVVAEEGRFRHVSYAHDGSHFAYAGGASVYLHDFAQETLIYTDPDQTSSFSPPVFGRDDALLYAKWCSGDNQCDLVAVDPEAGTKVTLGVPAIRPDQRTAPHIGWAPRTRELDGDGDGVGDGIDDDR